MVDGGEPGGWTTATLVGGDRTYAVQAGSAELRSELLAPGSYELSVWGDGLARSTQGVVVLAGETTELAIELERGASVDFELDFGGVEVSQVTFVISGADGRERWRQTNNSSYPLQAVRGLALGTWRIRVETDTGLTAEVQLEITSLDTPAERISLQLR